VSFKKVENEDEFINKVVEASEKTPKSMYTYAVNMIVSVFAEDEEKARATLNENGGFVSHRNVELKDAVQIYNPEDKD
jgi:hypothetical protein